MKSNVSEIESRLRIAFTRRAESLDVDTVTAQPLRQTLDPRRPRTMMAVLAACAAVVLGAVALGVNHRDTPRAVAVNSGDTSATTGTSPPGSRTTVACGQPIPANASAVQLTATIVSPQDHPVIEVRNDSNVDVSINYDPTSLMLADSANNIVSPLSADQSLGHADIKPGETLNIDALPPNATDCATIKSDRQSKLHAGTYQAVGIFSVNGAFYASTPVTVTVDSNGELR